jgi:glucokinase
MKIVAADIGGTHARFALAEIAEGARPVLGAMRKYRTRDHDGLASAWAQFERDCGPLPPAAAIAVAAPIEGDMLTFMNLDWRIDRHALAGQLGLDRLTLLNDFGAVAQAVSVMGDGDLEPVTGPGELPAEGIISVIGPGTGLGVSILDRRGGGHIIETEAAHIGFCPLDEEEETVSRYLAGRYERASVERVVSGPGLTDIHRALGGEGEWDSTNAGELWVSAIAGSDPLAERALALLVRCFGAAAGDIALAHGATGVAITGSLAGRILPLLRGANFAARFTAKGRYRARMERTPVRLLTYPEPGLLGAAIAFQREFS